ncbi:MAG: hypothetical protein ACYTKD_16165 [Planctomycetota bacterium]|jgi:hypothetical protein
MAADDGSEGHAPASRSGPKTPEGRARSSANALKAGCTAEKHIAKAVGDDVWENVLGKYVREFAPTGPIEDLLVEGMACAAAKIKLTWSASGTV